MDGHVDLAIRPGGEFLGRDGAVERGHCLVQ
jgi:hypothetical protein